MRELHIYIRMIRISRLGLGRRASVTGEPGTLQQATDPLFLDELQRFLVQLFAHLTEVLTPCTLVGQLKQVHL